MSIYRTVKECSKKEVLPNEIFRVSIGLYAQPSSDMKGTDSVLILDSSGSMIKNGMEEMKKAACRYVDVIAQNSSSDCCKDMKDSQIAVVGFSDTARVILDFSKNPKEIKEAICSLEAKGYTNHADAFKTAYEIMKNSQNPKKAALLFTDGNSNVSGNVKMERNNLLSLGTEIYTGALSMDPAIKYGIVRNWASEEKEDHFFLMENKDDMDSVFEKIAASISGSFTKDIVINETVAPDFEIVGIYPPFKGTADLIDKRNINWKIDSLGENGADWAALSFDVKYTGSKRGPLAVNESIIYTDSENSKVTFPNPTITIANPQDTDLFYEEAAAEPVKVVAKGCQDAASVDTEQDVLQSHGRMIMVNVHLKNVCPNRRTALNIMLTEVDPLGNEQHRGMKTILVPAHSENTCRDIDVKNIKFAVPEEISLAEDSMGICGERTFNVRTFANYIDSDYTPYM